ncbi:tetratricopeptide repeat protein [Leptospira ilyithenensis]|uniref:Tetratricopeptide repeat protein n=1 Tax=Leptospira ilyithenensis TaxID=2484901 RepID=A0A4R9LJ46_9LEPT|nr:hypothetical protein [Leptospira ilyithenensis]TGN06843.1 hypothetical protein EHS11_16985 [Leptospira ilyithenensis]
MYLFFSIYVICLFSISPLFSEETSFKSLYDEYKRGNYETVSRLTEKILNSKTGNRDPRIFYLYVATEQDWEKIKARTGSFPIPTGKDSSHYFNALYLAMERALVLGEYESLIKWGRLFQKEGKGNSRYVDAVLILAAGLLELKNPKEALKAMEELDNLNPSPKNKEQMIALKNEIGRDTGN